MVFNFFRKKKQTPPQTDFDYFPSEKEKPGLQALPLKKKVEEALTQLENKAKKEVLTPQELEHQQELEAQLKELLSSGQVNKNLHARLAVAQSSNDTSYSDWVNTEQQHDILLVDDDKDLAELLQFCVGRIASEVHVLHDGEDVLTWIEKNPPVSLVSLDLMLPRKDGLQLITHIRKHQAWKHVPILVVSSKSDEGTVQKVLAAGADTYLAKPIQPEAYLARIQKLLNR